MAAKEKHVTHIPLTTLLPVIGLSIAAGFAIVYMSLVGTGNKAKNISTQAPVAATNPAKTTGAEKTGKATAQQNDTNSLTGYNKGELAAFLIHKEPQDLPNITFFDAQGKSYALSDWKGKTVLLNLWATWCAPCRKEMPDLNALQQHFSGEKFDLLALNVDKGNLDKPAAFFKKLGINNLKLYGGENSHKLNPLLRAPGLPVTILVNPDGKESGRLVGPAHWNSKDARELIAAALGK